jgi:hypothetical protein
VNTIFKIFVFLAFAYLVSSCGDDKPVEATYELQPFDEIRVNNYFHIYLIQDTVFSITVTSDKDIMEGVKFSVDNRILSLSHESNKLWLNPDDHEVKLYISADRLKTIEVNETCYIETVNPIISNEFGIIKGYRYFEAHLELDCNIFYFWNGSPCGGRLTLEGNTRYLRLWNYIIMSVDAANLNADHVFIENYSPADCIVRAKETLEYGIYGNGNIYLYGKPDQIIMREITSSGKLIRLE